MTIIDVSTEEKTENVDVPFTQLELALLDALVGAQRRIIGVQDIDFLDDVKGSGITLKQMHARILHALRNFQHEEKSDRVVTNELIVEYKVLIKVYLNLKHRIHALRNNPNIPRMEGLKYGFYLFQLWNKVAGTYPTEVQEAAWSELVAEGYFNDDPEPTDDPIRERLAQYAHEAWSGWMEWVWSHSIHNDDGTVTIPQDWVSRWSRQMTTEYSDLPEDEKDSDRHEADEILGIIKGEVR